MTGLGPDRLKEVEDDLWQIKQRLLEYTYELRECINGAASALANAAKDVNEICDAVQRQRIALEASTKHGQQ